MRQLFLIIASTVIMTSAFAAEMTFLCDKFNSNDGQPSQASSHEIKVITSNQNTLTGVALCKQKCSNKNKSSIRFSQFTANSESYHFKSESSTAFGFGESRTNELLMSKTIIDASFAQSYGEGLVKFSTESVGFFKGSDYSFSLYCRMAGIKK